MAKSKTGHTALRESFAERKGQRREPAADDVRVSIRANRLAPVRWTVWFGDFMYPLK
jgi:hypothetical protein